MIKIGCGNTLIFDKQKSRNIWILKDGKLILIGCCFIGEGCKINVEKGGILEFGDRFKISA